VSKVWQCRKIYIVSAKIYDDGYNDDDDDDCDDDIRVLHIAVL